MNKVLLNILILLFLPISSLIAMEGESTASVQADEEQEVVGVSLANLPAEVLYNIVTKLIENIKDKNSLQEALKTIASLEQVSKRFADLINDEQNKDFLKKKLADQIKEHGIKADLFDAAKFKSRILAELLLIKQGTNVNAKDQYGETSLHYAAFYNTIGVAKLLIENGADVNAKDKYEETPLYKAAGNNSKEIAELLIKNRADVNDKDFLMRTPLHWAAGRNSKEVAELLIENGADVNAKEQNGETPLHAAVWKNSKDVAELLIEKDADVHAKDNKGQKPLDLAGTPEMQQLITRGQ